MDPQLRFERRTELKKVSIFLLFKFAQGSHNNIIAKLAV